MPLAHIPTDLLSVNFPPDQVRGLAFRKNHKDLCGKMKKPAHEHKILLYTK